MSDFQKWLAESYPNSVRDSVPKDIIEEYLEFQKEDNKESNYRSLWQTFELDPIIAHFLRDFNATDPQEKIENFEYYIDPFKKKVIVKFWIEKGLKENK